uniref:Hemicentin-1-like von Willebrand factor A domain-containing protein n=1 Tax=uncultured Armatimonadetes bacterium TaxID=157466 RepID=A0A6J4ISS5_9BACT|nr:hypothetical protein AVDCRST_MAG63-2327 [uncultured Armatimonadetes bacterium]
MSDNDALNRVDLCFVVDTTGSMGMFIKAAQRHLLDAMDALRAGHDIDLRVGLTEYRDHPPQERSFVTRFHAPKPDLQAMQKAINALKAEGGGDAPEAVFDGVHAACGEMPWREHSRRFVLLVGDAPPHGARAHERREEAPEAEPAGGRGRRSRAADLCPCGLTVHDVTAAAESRNVTVHALCMVADAATVGAFTAIAGGTGGACAPAQSADKIVGTMGAVLEREFSSLPFDRETLRVARGIGEPDTERVAEALGCPRVQAAASLARLGKRGFLDALSAA